MRDSSNVFVVKLLGGIDQTVGRSNERVLAMGPVHSFER